MKGQFVKIIGSSSVFEDFLGRYGVIKEYAYGDKWTVEFNARVGNKGSLYHTVSEKDFEVINQVNPVKKGKWVSLHGIIHCSNCNSVTGVPTCYCSDCGADMREDKDE